MTPGSYTSINPERRIEGLRNLRKGYNGVVSAVGFWQEIHGEDLIEEYARLFEQFDALRDELERIAVDPARALSLYQRGVVSNPASRQDA